MLAILQTTGTVPCDKLREAIPATDRLNDPDSVGFNSVFLHSPGAGMDDVAYLKTMTGDTMTIDGAAMTATLKTADGVFPVAVEAPEEAGRRLQFGGAFGGALLTSGSFTMMAASGGF